MAGWIWFRCVFGPNLTRTHRSPDTARPDGRVARRVCLHGVMRGEQNPSGTATGVHVAECCAKRVSLRLTLAVLAKCRSVIETKKRWLMLNHSEGSIAS